MHETIAAREARLRASTPRWVPLIFRRQAFGLSEYLVNRLSDELSSTKLHVLAPPHPGLRLGFGGGFNAMGTAGATFGVEQR